MKGEWVRESTNGITVVFVHGILSNGEDCWKHKNGSYWPYLLRDEQDFQNIGIYVYSYQTGFFSGTYSLNDVVTDFKERLFNLDEVIFSEQKIVFVCHSMGGIVSRKLLVERFYDFQDQQVQVGLFLVASPSLGSDYANFGKLISYALGNSQAKILRFSESNDWLNDLHNSFKNIKDRLNIIGKELVEDKAVYRMKIMPPVVKPFSAAQYFPECCKIHNSDHFSIAKPQNQEADQHRLLKIFIQQNFKISNQNCDKSSRISESSSVQKILFDIYRIELSPYYLERTIDKQLQDTLSLYSIWLSGKSGCGKTTAARHLIYQQGYKPLEIYLANCRNLNSDNIIEEITETACQRFGLEKKCSLSELTKILAEHAEKSPIVLYIDEIPISENDIHGLDELVTVIANLLDSIKQITGKENIRFIISSIQNPRKHSSTITSKFAEQIKTIDLALWSDIELDELLTKLMNYLQFSPLTTTEKYSLVQEAHGLPRFIKIYLRNKAINSQANHQDLLQMTIEQMVI